MQTTVIAFCSCYFLVFVLSKIAPHLRLLDIPGGRKHHGEATPQVGGIAIYISLVWVNVYLGSFEATGFALICGFLVFVGALDDAKGLGVRARLLVQIGSGIAVATTYDLFITDIGFGDFASSVTGFVVSVLLTTVVVVSMINVFNFSDGIDGLSSGYFLISAMSLLGVSVCREGLILERSFVYASAGTVFAFWLINLSISPFRKVFLGDAGSNLLGFLVCWALIYLTQAPSANLNPLIGLWCVTFPVFDMVAVIIRRIWSGCSPFKPDRSHMHHILVDNGMTERSALLTLLILASLLNAFGLLIVSFASVWIGLTVYAGLILGYCLFVTNRKYLTSLVLKFTC